MTTKFSKPPLLDPPLVVLLQVVVAAAAAGGDHFLKTPLFLPIPAALISSCALKAGGFSSFSLSVSGGGRTRWKGSLLLLTVHHHYQPSGRGRGGGQGGRGKKPFLRRNKKIIAERRVAFGGQAPLVLTGQTSSLLLWPSSSSAWAWESREEILQIATH